MSHRHYRTTKGKDPDSYCVFRSHTVPCTGRAGPLEAAGDKDEQLDFVKCPHQASHLTATVREERQPTLLDPSLDSPTPLPSCPSFSNLPGLLAQPSHTLPLPAGLFPQQSSRASTHCQANILTRFSGEGTGALLRGQNPKLLADGTPLTSAKCHGWPSLLPGELELPALGYQGADPLLWPDGLAWTVLPILRSTGLRN